MRLIKYVLKACFTGTGQMGHQIFSIIQIREWFSFGTTVFVCLITPRAHSLYSLVVLHVSSMMFWMIPTLRVLNSQWDLKPETPKPSDLLQTKPPETLTRKLNLRCAILLLFCILVNSPTIIPSHCLVERTDNDLFG